MKEDCEIDRRSFVKETALTAAGISVAPRDVLGGPDDEDPAHAPDGAAAGAGGHSTASMRDAPASPPPSPEEWTKRQHKRVVSVDDHEVEMAYYDSGEDVDERPVVFLHGIPTWSYLWRHVVPALEEERRVIAPDMVGYGNSAMRDGVDRSLRAQERALMDLLEQLDIDTFDFVGHDLGGGVALRIAAHTNRIGRLVLSNAVMYDSWPVPFIVELGLPGTINDMSTAELVNTLEDAFRDTLVDPDEAFVNAMSSRYASDTGRISLSRNAISTNTNHTTELNYDAIGAETWCVWGANDDAQPVEYAERLAEDLENSVGVLRLDARHWVPEDRPKKYTRRVVEFLTAE